MMLDVIISLMVRKVVESKGSRRGCAVPRSA